MRPDGAGLLGVLLVAVCVWHLVHGVAVGTYQQFHQMGDMPVAAGPVGEARASQLGHVGYFWSERAFHYRTTLMFAVDDFHDPSLLAGDTFQQYPEGVNAWREYTLLMEPVYGTLYRWFGRDREILVEFLLRLIPLIHVLLLPGLYGMARALGARPLAAFAGVLVYAGCSLGYTRLAGSLLLKETFALLFFVGFLTAHFAAWERGSRRLLAVACAMLAVFLAAWHLSQFLLLPVAVFSAVAALMEPDDERRLAWRMPAAYLLTMMAVGFTPSLLARGFLVGPAVMVLLALLASLVLARRLAGPGATATRRLGLLAGLLILLLGVSVIFSRLMGDYSHVSGLAVQKVLHGFRLPEDPARLPFDVRVFWVPPFTSPTWGEMKARLGWEILLLLPAVAWAVRTALRRETAPPVRAFCLSVPAYLVAWLVIGRLGVVFLPLAAVTVALAAGSLAGDRSGRRRLLVFGTIAAVVAVNLGTIMRPDMLLARDVTRGRPVALQLTDLEEAHFRSDLLRWLKINTPGHHSRYGAAAAPAAILADIGLSPQISLYARRPTVLNSQFENAFIRARYRVWLTALFAVDPALLETFLRATETDYMVVGRDWLTSAGPGSAPYQAGKTEPYPLDCVLARLQFHPTELGFLQPVYNNAFFRVFKVLPPGETSRAGATWDRTHGIWWQQESFNVTGDVLADVRADRTRLLRYEVALIDLQREQGELMAAGEPRGAPGLGQLHQQLLQTRLDLARAAPADRARLQDRDRQLTEAIKARLGQPGPGGGSYGQALANLLRRKDPAGRPGWLDLMEENPVEPMHLAAAGQLAGLLGRYSLAADLLDRAAAFLPAAPVVDGLGRPGAPDPFLVRQIRSECIWWNMGAGRLARARDLAETALPTTAADDPARRIYEILLNLE